MARARHYNVQLFRSGRKIYTAWPSKPQLKLKARWKYQGRTYRLKPGTYTWIVWPNVRGRYVKMLGQSNFKIVK